MKLSRRIMKSWIELMAQNEDCLSAPVPIMVNRVHLTISKKTEKGKEASSSTWLCQNTLCWSPRSLRASKPPTHVTSCSYDLLGGEHMNFEQKYIFRSKASPPYTYVTLASSDILPYDMCVKHIDNSFLFCSVCEYVQQCSSNTVIVSNMSNILIAFSFLCVSVSICPQ